MSSKYKIIILTLIITLGFLGRDTVTISGPVYMVPTYITFFASLGLSFVFIILTENRKTHNHSKMVLATVNFFVSLVSIILAYFLDLASYQDISFFEAGRGIRPFFIGVKSIPGPKPQGQFYSIQIP